MKILARENIKAEKMPFSAQVLQVIGVSQFISAAWLTFALTALFRNQIGPDGVIIGVIISVDLGLSASVISFAMARLVSDMHAVRWNSDGYTVEKTSDELEEMRRLRSSLDRLSQNIESMTGMAAPPEPVEAPAAETTAPDIDPYDDYDAYEDTDAPEQALTASLDEQPPRLNGVLMKLAFVLIGVLIVGVIILVIAILNR